MTDTLPTDTLLIDTAEGVTTLTLNRPDALNSLDRPLKEALRDTLSRLASDASCRAIVLTGAGRGFCAGQDLREHAETLRSGTSDPLATVKEHYNPITETLATMPKPVVAAVRGVAAGAGASLTFLADFRIGGPGTRFQMSFANAGLAGDTGASWTLPRLVGYARATEMLMLARPVKADEALSFGLLTELVDSDERVLPAAQELAARLATGPTVAYGLIKRQLAIGASGSLADALEAEYQAQSTCGATADHRDATEAFLNKQTPVFGGR